MEPINRFAIEPSSVNPGFPYNVSVHTSVDGGKTFWYCGNGRFCRNLTDVFKFIRAWTDPFYEVVDYRDRRAPGTEIVTEKPEGWHVDVCTHDKPIHGEWVEDWRTGERKILYTGR